VNDGRSGIPDGFGALGTGRYGSAAPHPKGEIWCATLTKATRDLATALGDKAHAYAIAWQSVVDGLKLTPRNPSFLDARDAIVAAIDDLRAGGLITDAEHAQTRRAFWVAFAHFEMGVNASSAGASLSGIVGDTMLPDDVAAEIVVGRRETDDAPPHLSCVDDVVASASACWDNHPRAWRAKPCNDTN
jgi:extracellular elastinolytic metalloproteinase